MYSVCISAEFKGGSHSGVFLQVVGCINKNLHLVEKLFREIILPLIQLVNGGREEGDGISVTRLCPYRYPPVANRCNERKREIMVKLEGKIETGIERCQSLLCSIIIVCLLNDMSSFSIKVYIQYGIHATFHSQLTEEGRLQTR